MAEEPSDKILTEIFGVQLKALKATKPDLQWVTREVGAAMVYSVQIQSSLWRENKRLTRQNLPLPPMARAVNTISPAGGARWIARPDNATAVGRGWRINSCVLKHVA